MSFEIDMLNVGNADAIIIRYFNEVDEEFVVLIDAGKTIEHGKKIEHHIKTQTTKKAIDLAINTHPDRDHIGGFFYLLDTDIEINEFWIHDPSLHKIRKDLSETIKTNDIEKALKNELLNNTNDLVKSLSYVYESLQESNSILKIIDKKKIPRLEPFDKRAHSQIPIQVLGPSATYYEKKLDRYRDINLLYEEQTNLLLEKSQEAGPLSAAEVLLTYREYIDQKNDRSNENNSSVILCFKPDNDIYLFTADAGPEALIEIKSRYKLSNLYFLQIPHHGSRYNITSELLDYFDPDIAYISCKQTSHYPSPQIVNILKENGCIVFATGINGSLRHSNGLGTRNGYSVSKGI